MNETHSFGLAAPQTSLRSAIGELDDDGHMIACSASKSNAAVTLMAGAELCAGSHRQVGVGG